MPEVESLCERAHIWVRQGRYLEAEAAYREAVRVDPGRLSAYLGLGLVLRRQRRSVEAEAVFKQAILLQPRGVSAHLELGGALFEQTRYAEAAAAFREAIRLRPDSPQAHVSLGLALSRRGEWLETGQHINAAGSNSLIRREIDETAVAKCDLIVVDSRDTARNECGDLLPAVEKGALQWETLPEIGEIMLGRLPGRASERQITLYESHGMGLQDLYLGAKMLERARERGIGADLPIGDGFSSKP